MNTCMAQWLRNEYPGLWVVTIAFVGSTPCHYYTTTREYFEWLILVPFGILLFLLSNDPNFFYSFPPFFFCFCFQLLWNIKIPFRRRRRKERHPSVKGITRLTRHAVGVVRFRFIFKRKSAVPVGIQRPKCVPTNLWKRLIVVVRLVLDVWDTWKL